MEELNEPADEPLMGREVTAMDMVGNLPVMVPLPSLEELIWMSVQEVCQLHELSERHKNFEYRILQEMQRLVELKR